MTTTIAVVSDLHCGSTVGLHPDSPTTLDDGGTYQPTPAQGWLWAKWTAYWGEVKRAAKGSRLAVILNGDLLDGDHHGTTQIVSRHPGVQVDILFRTLDPMLALKPAAVIVVRGTEAHVGAAGSGEEGVAKGLAARGVPIAKATTGTFSWWHFVGQFGPLRLSATHHGRMGQRPWTKGSVSSNLAATIFYEHAARGEPHPQLAFRSHYHRTADSGDSHPVRVIQTPAWQLATSYAHRVAADTLADIGGMVVRVGTTDWQVTKHLYRPDPPSTWTMP